MVYGCVKPTGTVVDEDDILRWLSEVRPLPLTEGHIPTGGAPLRDLTDDVLLNAPPHMIAHMQRTAAQGGLQVISPRQIPITALMVKTHGEPRELGDHIVGSTACEDVKWPTLFDDDLDHLLPDQPLCPNPATELLREKTRTEPLTKAGKHLADPILRCLMKGRAVIDVLRRDDVSGGAEELTSLLCRAWGITRDEMDDLDALTVGITGPLLRHAIKVDDVYPMLHAPIQVKRSIGVGVSELTRAILPEDSAMDWRRMRVFCEAVYYLATSSEGLSLLDLRANPPPGDPVASGARKHVLCFMPAPGSAWYHGPETFSVTPVVKKTHTKTRGIPPEVYRALTKYVEIARPVTHLILSGHNARARKSTAMPPSIPRGETISQCYSMMVKCMVVGSARGKTAAATVRNVVYRTLENAPMPVRLRLARYLHIAKAECRTHLGVNVVPDRVVDRIANRFRGIGEMIRMEIAAEASRRNSTANEWWSDILAQAPDRYSMFTEGTMGWSRVAFWLLFRGPTERWDALVKAVHYSALKDVEMLAVSSMALPPTYGSTERIEAVGRVTVRRITQAFSGYYMGVSDVGMAVADELEATGKERSAGWLREGSFLWSLRARSLRGANVYAIAKGDETKSELHTRLVFPNVDLVVAPSPYRAFEAYGSHVVKSQLLSNDFKAHYRNYDRPDKSGIFRDYRRILGPVTASTVTRYLTQPWQLGDDMERGWSELCNDIRKNVESFAIRERPRVVEANPEELTLVRNTFGPGPVVRKDDYYATMAKMDIDEIEWMECLLEGVPDDIRDFVMERDYATVGELRVMLQGIESDMATGSFRGRETVV